MKTLPAIGDRVEINGYQCARELLGEKGVIVGVIVSDGVHYANIKLDNTIEGLNDNTANICLADIHPTKAPAPTMKQQGYKGVEEIKAAPVGWYWARYYATGAPEVILIGRRVYDNEDGETTCLNFPYPNEVYLTANATNETRPEEAYLVIFGPLEIPHF